MMPLIVLGAGLAVTIALAYLNSYWHSRASGWHRLAELFPGAASTEGDPRDNAYCELGKRAFFPLGLWGNVRVTVGARGLGFVSVLWWPGRFHPPIFVPWSSIDR